MTGRPALPASRQQRPADGWRLAVPELTIAAGLVTVAAAAGYALGGPSVMAVVVIVAAAGAGVVLRGLPAPPQDGPSLAVPEPGSPFGPSFASSLDFWRRRTRMAEGTQSRGAYNAGLRRTLEHLLASRLAERHGISLYDDPAAARRLLCPGGRDGDLWSWIDPAGRPAESGPPRDAPGIPPGTLTRLIDRLEQL